MLENGVRFLKLVCLVLAVLLASQLYEVAAGDSLEGDDLVVAPAAGGATGDGTASEKTPPTDGEVLPEVYAGLLSSGLFGKAPPQAPPSPPALVGLMDGRERQYAVLRGADGSTFRLAEGEEKNGVTLVRVGTNRVLVRFQGKELELSQFSGLGGEPLLSPEKDKPEKNKTEKDKPEKDKPGKDKKPR